MCLEMDSGEILCFFFGGGLSESFQRGNDFLGPCVSHLWLRTGASPPVVRAEAHGASRDERCAPRCLILPRALTVMRISGNDVCSIINMDSCKKKRKKKRPLLRAVLGEAGKETQVWRSAMLG